MILLRLDGRDDLKQSVLESLDGPQAWDSLLGEADAGAVTPLVYDALKAHRERIPAEAWQHLRRAQRQTGMANALLLDECRVVVHDLARRGIGVLVFKGAALAEALYHNVALRPFNDLDLLVRREELAAARATLAERGYAPEKAEHHPGTAEQFGTQERLARWDSRTGLKIVCELHWHLLDSPYYQQTMSLDWFWQTAVPLRLGDTRTQTLGPEARLLHLCAHLALHHQGARLLWTCDIDRALRAEAGRLDWDEVIARAEEYRLVLPLQHLTARTVEWLGTPVRAAVMARLNSLEPGREEARVFGFLAGQPQAVIARFVDDLRYLPGGRARVRFVMANVFPAPAYMRQRYSIRHNWLLPLAYLYRLGRGARDAFALLARR